MAAADGAEPLIYQLQKEALKAEDCGTPVAWHTDGGEGPRHDWDTIHKRTPTVTACHVCYALCICK